MCSQPALKGGGLQPWLLSLRLLSQHGAAEFGLGCETGFCLWGMWLLVQLAAPTIWFLVLDCVVVQGAGCIASVPLSGVVEPHLCWWLWVCCRPFELPSAFLVSTHAPVKWAAQWDCMVAVGDGRTAQCGARYVRCGCIGTLITCLCSCLQGAVL